MGKADVDHQTEVNDKLAICTETISVRKVQSVS